MSVTFWCPQAPTEKVKPYDDEPGYVEGRSLLPEINLSNSNAAAMSRLLELGNPAETWGGECLVADLPRALERVNAFLTDPVLRQFGVQPGRDDDYLQRTCSSLQRLVSTGPRESIFGVLGLSCHSPDPASFQVGFLFEPEFGFSGQQSPKRAKTKRLNR